MELTSENLQVAPSSEELTLNGSADTPATEINGEAINEWLPLTDYAAKYRISVSTLRRRIKTNQISHRFIDGKYMLLDSRPAELDHSYHQQESLGDALNSSSAADFLRDLGFQQAEVKPVAATSVMEELKAAYMRILHEKEEMIIQLKEEVSDLHTLVRVLEQDNDRMRKYLGFTESPHHN